MRNNPKFYRRLFTSTFTLSAFTFGGGYVIVPLMRKKFVDGLHWLEEDEMLDITALAQSAPGVIAVNTSILLGYRLAGVPGALITLLGTVLPPLIIITVISMFYESFRDNAVVSAVLRGMQAGVAAVIIDVVCGMAAKSAAEAGRASIALMLACFIAAFVCKVNVVLIILACGIGGAFVTYRRMRRERGGQA